MQSTSFKSARNARLVSGLLAYCVVVAVVLGEAVVACAAVWEPAGPNLLADGGFEQGIAPGWSLDGDATAVAADENVARTGKRSLKVLADGHPQSVRIVASAKVDPTKKYRVSFAAKAEGLGKDPKLPTDIVGDIAAGVGLVALADGRWLQWCPAPEAVGISGTSDWKTYSFDVRNLPTTSTSVQLHLILHSGARGTLWFDDVELKELVLRRPSLTLASKATANIFCASEEPEVEARLQNDGTPRELTLRWEISAAPATQVAKRERKVTLGADESRVERISLGSDVGHYVVAAELADGDASTDNDRIETAIVPDVPSHPCPSLGAWMGDPALVAKMGASWTRNFAFWRYLESEPGKCNLDELVATLKQTRAAGLKTVLCFSQTPAWASSAPEGSADFAGYPPKKWDDLARFVETVVRRVGDDVTVWEVWNEPVIPWGWKGSPEDVVTLHRVVREAIRRVRPDAIVLGPCIGECMVPTLKLKAFQDVVSLGILDYCDGLVIHPYRTPLAPEATFLFEDLSRIREFAEKKGVKQGVWITEIGWSSAESPFYPKHRVSELDQAAYVPRSIVAAVAAGVQLYTWHSLCEWDVADPHERSFGLVRAGLTGPKPAYVSYAVCAHHLAGARFVRRLTDVGRPCPQDRFTDGKLWDDLRPASSRAVDGYYFERDGKPLLIAWSISGEEEVVEVPASATVQLQDALGRISQQTPQAERLTLRLSDLPVYVEFPMLRSE